jgi:hypothetical protein
MSYEYKTLALASPDSGSHWKFADNILKMDELALEGWELDHTIPLLTRGICNKVKLVFKRER